MESPDPLLYIIRHKPREDGKKGNEWIRLQGPAWPLRLGIYNIEFISLRAAAYFAQHHAAGRAALLRVDLDSYGFGPERAIPPVAVQPVPLPREDIDEETAFLEFFNTWPGPCEVNGSQPHPAQRRHSRATEHPAAFRWDGKGNAVPTVPARDQIIATERARLQAIITSDEPDGKWAQDVARAKSELARIDRGEWPLDEPDDTPY